MFEGMKIKKMEKFLNSLIAVSPELGKNIRVSITASTRHKMVHTNDGVESQIPFITMGSYRTDSSGVRTIMSITEVKFCLGTILDICNDSKEDPSDYITRVVSSINTQLLQNQFPISHAG